MTQDPHDHDAERADDDLLDEFAREKEGEMNELEPAANSDPAPPSADLEPEPEPEADEKDKWPARLNAMPDAVIAARGSPSPGPAVLVPSRPGELSPRKIAEAHMFLILLWIFRFGWSTREITDRLRGTKGDGATSTLINRKLLAEFPAANPLAIRANHYVCLTEAGVEALRQWLEAWEEEIELSFMAAQLPAAYPAWARVSLPPSITRYRSLGGRIRHARAQHDWLLQKWFLQVLLRCEPAGPWSVTMPCGVLMPADWGSTKLTAWHFADELESIARTADARPLPHAPDLELRTTYYGGHGGLKIIEVELENSRKRDDEIDAQLGRSAGLFDRGQFIDEACTKHTLIIATSDLLYKHWRDAFKRSKARRWVVRTFRKRVADGYIQLTLPAGWRERAAQQWIGEVLRNIEAPASLVRLRHDRSPAAKIETKPRRPRKAKPRKASKRQRPRAGEMKQQAHDDKASNFD